MYGRSCVGSAGTRRGGLRNGRAESGCHTNVALCQWRTLGTLGRCGSRTAASTAGVAKSMPCKVVMEFGCACEAQRDAHVQPGLERPIAREHVTRDDEPPGSRVRSDGDAAHKLSLKDHTGLCRAHRRAGAEMETECNADAPQEPGHRAQLEDLAG